MGGPLLDAFLRNAFEAIVMTSATLAWLEGLRAATATSRRSAPSEPEATPAETAAARMILGAHLTTWIDAAPSLLVAREEWARGVADADPDAALVFTTSPVGIALAEAALAVDEPVARDLKGRVCCVTEPEYRRWCMRHPDEGRLLHVNHWSWIKTSVPAAREAEFARHSLRPGERFWLHRTGTAGAGTVDGRAAHLWKFTGEHAVLLEAFVVEHGVRPPRA